jgi:NADPH:quinone reductase
LRRRGRMVSFGNATGPVAPFDCALLAKAGSVYATRPGLFDYIARREELLERSRALFDGVSAGTLKVAINQRYALRDAAQAHRDLEARKTTGSTILLP